MEIKGITVRNDLLEEVAGITPEYPFTMHHADMRTTHIPWHWHEEVEFLYLRSGSMKVTTINQTYVFHQGEGLFTNSNILTSMEGYGEAPEIINESYLFHPIFLSGHFKSVFETKYVAPVIHDKRFDLIGFRGETQAQKKILSLLEKAPRILGVPDSEFHARNLFSEIWLLLIEEIRTLEKDHLPPKRIEQDRIQTMISYIQNHYMEHVSLADIAGAAAISTREGTRCFKNTIRRTPFEYLMDYRIEMAEKLLSDTEEPVTDIALKCGFSNGAYFSKIFKEYRKMTPGAFRKQKSNKKTADYHVS